MDAGVVDQVHVMHARGTCGHAGKTAEATIDVLDHLGRGRPVFLEHLFHEVDAPAGAVELVAEQHIGRAGGRAEAAMDTGSQDAIGLLESRLAQLRLGEMCLHGSVPFL